MSMELEINRYGEKGYTPFRSRRLYVVNGRSFFDTREGTQFGPYRDRKEAEMALALFVSNRLSELNYIWPENEGPGYGIQDGIEPMLEELMEYFYQCRYRGKVAGLAWAKNRIKFIGAHHTTIDRSIKRIEAIEYVVDKGF